MILSLPPPSKSCSRQSWHQPQPLRYVQPIHNQGRFPNHSQYYIRHTIDARRATPRNSDANPKAIHFANYTMSAVKSYVDSEARGKSMMDALSSSKDKDAHRSSKDPTITDISGWQDQVVGWQRGRTLSTQEADLVRAGIVSAQQSAQLFDRDKRCWVTNDPRPVHYPWENTGPGDDVFARASL